MALFQGLLDLIFRMMNSICFGLSIRLSKSVLFERNYKPIFLCVIGTTHFILKRYNNNSIILINYDLVVYVLNVPFRRFGQIHPISYLFLFTARFDNFLIKNMSSLLDMRRGGTFI